MYRQNGIWRSNMLLAIDHDSIQEKVWDLKLSTLSHTPQTEQGVQDLNYNYKELFKDFESHLKLIEGKISYSQYIQKRNSDDGKMITVASDR